MTACSWDQWWKSRECWRPCNSPCHTLGLELKMRRTTVWGAGLVPALSSSAAATRLHLEEETEVLGISIPSTLYAFAVEANLGNLGAKFAQPVSAVEGLADTQSAHALLRNSLGPAEVQYALRTQTLRHTAAFGEGITVTQRSTWITVVGTPVSVAAWVQATLPISEGGCGSASASDVAPVARQLVATGYWLRPATGRTLGHQGGAAGCPQRPPESDARAPCELEAQR